MLMLVDIIFIGLKVGIFYILHNLYQNVMIMAIYDYNLLIINYIFILIFIIHIIYILIMLIIYMLIIL
jgi:hypothetical protein